MVFETNCEPAGSFRRKRDVLQLRVACSGTWPLFLLVVRSLAEGAFDASILSGPAGLGQLAARRGWVRPDLRCRPLEPDKVASFQAQASAHTDCLPVAGV